MVPEQEQMMVAQNMLPDNPEEDSRIRHLLDSDAELREVVERIGAYSSVLFPDATLSLNTRQHDEWDPPLSLLVTVPYVDKREFARRDRQFISWLTKQSGYDPDRLFVMVLPHHEHLHSR